MFSILHILFISIPLKVCHFPPRRSGVLGLRGPWVSVALPPRVLRCHVLCACFLPSSVVTDAYIHDGLLFLMQVVLVQLSSQHPLVLLTREVVNSVALHVMGWPCAFSSVTQLSTQASSPKYAIQLLPHCTGSRFQPSHFLWEVTNLPEAFSLGNFNWYILKVFIFYSSFL